MMRKAFASIVALFLAAPAMAATIVVSPSNMNGWSFYTTDSSGLITNPGTGTGDFVTGPATPPLPVGSAHLQTGAGQGDGSVQLRTNAFSGTLLASITSLSYSTYATSFNGAQLPYLTLWIDTNNDGVKDDRIWFEPDYSNGTYGPNNPFPAQGPVALNTWQTWDTLNGMWYNDNGPSGPGADAITLAQYEAANPTATIVGDSGQNIGGFRIATGFASAGDNFNTYVDNLTFGTAAGTTTFNFEPASPVPLPASVWGGLALVAGFGIVRRLRPSPIV
jgi:hypothetical protein